MARRRDPMMEELREIRRELSKEMLEAERKEGSWIPLMRRLGRQARRKALKLVGNGKRKRRK